MIEGAQDRLGFSAIGGREAKAKKIFSILAAAGNPLKPTQNALDLDCGSGEIAAHLAMHANVSCADAVDQRVHGRELPFRMAGSPLPFDDASFDVVISNHVIEHTADPDAHLREIRRILRPDGICYLATPNRVWPWEVHSRLPLLHYLPWPWFSGLGMAAGRLSEPVHLLSLGGLRRRIGQRFDMVAWHPRLLHSPERFALRLPDPVAAILRRVPPALLELTAGVQPTLIVLLRPQ
jgi:SAM-dependent methyltransferase